MKAYHFYHRRITALVLALLPLAAWTQSLHSSPGIHLVVTGTPNIVLQDIALVNDGEINAGNSIFIFTGNAPSTTAFIGGSRPTAFYSLALNTTGSQALDNDISVAGILSMNNGNIELNNHTIDLGATGHIAGERNEARITGARGGTVKATALLNAPRGVDPGHIGVEITSAGNLGLTTIIRGHVAQNNATGQTGIQRYFDITPSVNNHLRASLRFYYFNNELAGNDKDGLSLFATKNGGQDWSLSGRDNSHSSGIAGWVIKNDLSRLSRFTLAMAKNTAAPVKAAALAWPNPSRDGFTLSVSSTVEKDYTISMYDQQGRLLEAKKLHCAIGNNQLQWDISKLAAATYYLRFSEPGVKNMAVVKQ